jgi:hypothetical protein
MDAILMGDGLPSRRCRGCKPQRSTQVNGYKSCSAGSEFHPQGFQAQAVPGAENQPLKEPVLDRFPSPHHLFTAVRQSEQLILVVNLI